MATKSKLTLLLELKDKLYNNKLRKATQKFRDFKDKTTGRLNQLRIAHVQTFRAMREEIPLFGRAMDLLGNPYTLIIAGAVAVTGVMAKGTMEAAKFNKEFLAIKNLNLDKSAASLSKYKTDIRDAAFEVGTNLQDSTRAFYDLQSATGVYGRDAVSIFKKIGRYSIATGANVNDSMNATTKAMKAFGLGVNDIDAYLASNAKTVQVGITTFDELAKVQTEYAGAAAGAGQNVDTANKVFAAFTSIAKDANTAATMTKSAFEGLTQPNTIKGLKKMGINMYDANGQMRDLGSILEDVSGQFKNMTPKQIDEVINAIGGPEGLRNMFVKLKTDAADFHNTLNAFDSSSFNLDEAFKNAQGDVTVMAGMVRNRLNTALAKLGEYFLPLVWQGLNLIDKGVRLAYEGMTQFQSWLESGTVWAEGFKVIMHSLGIAIAAYGTYMGTVLIVTELWTAAQWLLNVALTANPIGLVIAGIGALIGIIIYVRKQTTGWGKNFAALGDIFKAVWRQIVMNSEMQISEIIYRVELMKLRFRQFRDFVVGLFQNVGKAINLALSGDFGEAKKALAQKINSAASAEIDALQKAQQAKRAAFVKGTVDNANAIKEAWGKMEAIKWKKKSKEEAEEEGGGLLAGGGGGFGGDGSSPSGDAVAGQQLSSSVGGGVGPRSIVVNMNFEAFNKGGINTQNTTLAGMSKEEIEAWFREAMMRMIRNIETSYG